MLACLSPRALARSTLLRQSASLVPEPICARSLNTAVILFVIFDQIVVRCRVRFATYLRGVAPIGWSCAT